MELMGFRYNNRSKTLSIDGNKKTTKIMHMKDLCEKCITEYDPGSHRWVKINKEKLSILQRDV